ncbi:hypothetical protein OROGR_034283 [Orobanche gracilis]
MGSCIFTKRFGSAIRVFPAARAKHPVPATIPRPMV